ncbi:hypothetical protein HY483_00200 [Candidatus Woesearchaeota archaeon]|nr:hypothetical protein [Candidatus Woesearchaeota archaeon]
MTELIKIIMKKVSTGDFVFYSAMGVLTLWLILKIIGVIKTPLWLEYGVPLGSLILGGVMFYHTLTDSIRSLAISVATLATRVDHVEQYFKDLKEDMKLVKDELTGIRKDVRSV